MDTVSMSKTRRRNPNDPIQDFVDMQEHRYDPGYWLTEWRTKGRLTPGNVILREANFSSFYRALALMALIGSVPIGVFTSVKDELPYAWLWCMLTLAALFLGLWILIDRSMKRSKLKKSRAHAANTPDADTPSQD